MKRLLLMMALICVAAAPLAGCCCSWCQRQSDIVSVPVPPPTDINCPPGSQPGGFPVAPPGGIAPPPSTVPPPPAPPAPAPPAPFDSTPPPPPAFPNQPAASNFSPTPPAEDNWRPVEGRQIPPLPQYSRELAPAYPPIAAQPDYTKPEPPRQPYNPAPEQPRQPPLARIRLSPPEPVLDEPPPPPAKIEAPQDEPPTAPMEPTTPPPPPDDKVGKSYSFPVGIPQFSMAKDRVANGLRPSLDEGLDWLQKEGYRSVLYLRRPGDPDSADRNQVEKRGMRFHSIELSPNTLNENIVDAFFAAVRDTPNLPLYVYDRDGSLTGGLWYIYFRRIDNASEDAARVRAGSLGFREESDPIHRQMWQAVKQLNNDS